MYQEFSYSLAHAQTVCTRPSLGLGTTLGQPEKLNIMNWHWFNIGCMNYVMEANVDPRGTIKSVGELNCDVTVMPLDAYLCQAG